MKFRHIKIVYKKELKDLLRDKKTVFSTFILPLILFPLIMFLMGGGMGSLMGDVSDNPYETPVNMYVEPVQGAREAAREIFAGSKVNFVEAEPEEAEKLEEDFASKLEAQVPAQITVVYDEMSTNSQAKLSSVMQLIELYNTRVGYERLEALGVSPEILSPAVSETVTLSSYYGLSNREGSDNMFLQMMLPGCHTSCYQRAGRGY